MEVLRKLSTIHAMPKDLLEMKYVPKIAYFSGHNYPVILDHQTKNSM